MRGRHYRLTVCADQDIEHILAHTHREFGERQLGVYAALIEKATDMVGRAPMRPSSRARKELGSGVRSFHLEIAARRRGAASHVLYYVPAAEEEGARGAIILRVLWDGMDPWAFVEEALMDLE